MLLCNLLTHTSTEQDGINAKLSLFTPGMQVAFLSLFDYGQFFVRNSWNFSLENISLFGNDNNENAKFLKESEIKFLRTKILFQ